MRTFKTNLLGMALAGLILSACSQTGMYETADLMNEQAEASKSGFRLDPFGMSGENTMAVAFPAVDCSNPENCLERDTEYTFSESYSTGIIGNQNNNKRVDATVTLNIGADNMAYYRIDYSVTRTAGSSNGDTFMYGVLNGESFGSQTIAAGKLGQGTVSGFYETASFDYTTVECGDTFSFQLTEISIQGNGVLSDTNSLLAFCPDGCENEMTAALACGATNTVTYTFYAEEAGPVVIQGGLNANATITDASSNVLTRNTTHPSVSNSNASVTRWEGDVDACQMVTVTVSWTGPASVGDWSAKRGDVTLAEVAKETVVCPSN